MQAGPVVLADPEVRQVTIPFRGARVVIASDGLWDAVHYKTACHHVRSMTATKAAHALVRSHAGGCLSCTTFFSPSLVAADIQRFLECACYRSCVCTRCVVPPQFSLPLSLSVCLAFGFLL